MHERGGGPSVLAFGAVLMSAACASLPGPDLLLVGGPVWTGVPGAPAARGIAVRGNSIMAVGTEEEIRALAGRGTRVIELGGRMVTPGFIDTHTHFIEGGFSLAAVDLRAAATPAEFTRRLGEFAAALPPGRWILGGYWDHHRWGGTLPEHAWIDSAAAENPVWVWRHDGHMALANSLAMRIAGVDEETRAPAGGEMVRDASGMPTGIFKDGAMSLVSAHIPAPSEEEQDEALRAAMGHAAGRGVTGVHDMGTWADLATYRRARGRGELTLRVYAFVPLASWRRLAAEVAERGGTGDEWLRFGGVKGFVDGSLGSATAAFEEPYADEPDNLGLLVIPLDSLRSRIGAADSAGLHLAVHAIGDRANRLLLDAYEELHREGSPRDRRWRVEHAQHLRSGDIARFRRLGVIPSMQPYHAIDDGRWAEQKVGPERAATTYAFRSLLDAEATLTFGSDWTVAPLDPLLGLYAASTRRTLDGAHPAGWVPEQRISVEEALRAYTRSAAYAGFADRYTGTLEVGKRADIAVLSADLLAIPPDRIKAVRVDLTMVDGRIVFERRPPQGPRS